MAPVITCIEDLRRQFRRVTPTMFYDYCESGSYTEQTFRENVTDFDKLRFRQRVAVDMTNRTLKTTMLGNEVALPLALSPVGSTGMMRADGEIKAAKAALKYGVPFSLSTMSICSMEAVAEATQAPFWYQLYVMRDHEYTNNAVDRAKACGVSALIVTLDLQILGQRHKDLVNGLTAPPRPTLSAIADLSTRWRWGLEMLGTKNRSFGNIVGHAKDVGNLASLTSWANEQFDPRLDWDKVAQLRDRWGGKLILKGILDPEEARKAVELGADAIIVSNHGGRQLDGALSTIRVLPSIVREVKGEVEIWLDSGIRTGQDILKALALGADATMIGRAYIYGLGAMGERGVTTALDVLGKELDTTMALCGRRDIRDVNRDILLVPEDFEGRWADEPTVG